MLIDYLKQVCEIERNKFLLKQLLQNECDKSSSIEFEIKRLDEKKNKEPVFEILPPIPKEPQYFMEFILTFLVGAIIGVIVWFVLAFIALVLSGTNPNNETTESFLYVSIYVLLALDILVGIFVIQTSAKQYSEEMHLWNKVWMRNKNIKEEHNAICREWSDEINRLNKINKQSHENIKRLSDMCSEIESTLQKYYSLDIIYVKYQYMEAVYKLLEYLQSGRCNKLQGPSGAYDTYEKEYRTDIIINKLDRIICTMDELKTMNILLYQAVQQNNMKVAQIQQSIFEQNEHLAEVEQRFNYGIGVFEQNLEANRTLGEITATNLKNIEELVQYQNFAIKQQRLKDGYWY